MLTKMQNQEKKKRKNTQLNKRKVVGQRFQVSHNHSNVVGD